MTAINQIDYVCHKIQVCTFLGSEILYYPVFTYVCMSQSPSILVEKLDIIKFVLYTLISRDCVPICKYTKCYVYPKNQGTHDKLIQFRKIYRFSDPLSVISNQSNRLCLP